MSRKDAFCSVDIIVLHCSWHPVQRNSASSLIARMALVMKAKIGLSSLARTIPMHRQAFNRGDLKSCRVSVVVLGSVTRLKTSHEKKAVQDSWWWIGSGSANISRTCDG